MYDELPEPRKRNKSVIYTGFNVQGECLTGRINNCFDNLTVLSLLLLYSLAVALIGALILYFLAMSGVNFLYSLCLGGYTVIVIVSMVKKLKKGIDII